MSKIAALLLFAATLSHAAPPPDFPTDKAAALALDAPDFIQREKAARHLWQRGTAALPLLEKLAAGAGTAEPSLRARTIADNIRLGIAHDTRKEVRDLIRALPKIPLPIIPHSPFNGQFDQLHRTLKESLGHPDGTGILVEFATTLSETRPPGWQHYVAQATITLAWASRRHDFPGYDKLIDVAKDADVLPLIANYPAPNGLAYDALCASLPESLRPSPGRRDRVVALLNQSKGVSFRPRLIEAETAAGETDTVLFMLEKLLGGPSPYLRTIHSTKPYRVIELTRALIQRDRLKDWIFKYQKQVAEGPVPEHTRLALAHFLRAEARYEEAFQTAKSLPNPEQVIGFALFACEWGDAAALAEKIAATNRGTGYDKLAPSLPRFFSNFTRPDPDPLSTAPFLLPPAPVRLRYPGVPGFPTTDPLAVYLPARQYAAIVEIAKREPDLRIKIFAATHLAEFSPTLARKIVRGIAPEDLEKIRGGMGKFLYLKRLLGEEKPVIDYMSERFSTITSDFWEDFMRKYFVERGSSGRDNPLWIYHLLYETDRDRTRFDLMRETLTRGLLSLNSGNLIDLADDTLQAERGGSRRSNALELADRLKKALFAIDQARRSELADPDLAGEAGALMTFIKEELPENHDVLRLFEPEPPRQPVPFHPFRPENRLPSGLTELEMGRREAHMLDRSKFYLLGRHEMEVKNYADAVRWLGLATWSSLPPFDAHSKIDGIALPLLAHQSLESALGLQALENGDFPTARKRFRNFCAMGSLDHRLGTALYQKLLSSNQKTEAETLFTTRWNQLGAILEIAPRDAEVCRALSAWSKACGNRRASEAAVYADLAESLEKEQAKFKIYLTRFDW